MKKRSPTLHIVRQFTPLLVALTLGGISIAVSLSLSGAAERSPSSGAEPLPSNGGVSSTATATYRAAAKELIKQRLRDPNSAEFSEVHVNPGRAGRPTTVCGRVNAKNGFGGMAGAQRFIVGGTTILENDVSAADMAQLWTTFC